MRFKIILLALFIGLNCSFQQKNNNSIKGIWTDKSTENATFQINDKTIYYVDHLESYKYTFSNNTIKIYYPDYVFEGKVSFLKGVMTIKSSDGNVSKYWRFKG